jgi:hypothetical protein
MVIKKVAFDNEMVILRIPVMDESGYEAYRFPFGSPKIFDTVQTILEYAKKRNVLNVDNIAGRRNFIKRRNWK